MEKKNFSIKEAVKFGWDKMRENLGFFIIFIIISWLAGFFFSSFESVFSERLPMLSILFLLGYILVTAIFNFLFIRAGLVLCDGGRLNVSELFDFPPQSLLRFLAVNIIYILAVWVGFLLLLVPGIYIAMRFIFAPYLIVDKDTSIGESFSESSRITNGVKFRLLWFMIVICLINLAGVLVFFVGLLATLPTTMIALVWVYRKLYSGGGSPVVSADHDNNPFAAPGITR